MHRHPPAGRAQRLRRARLLYASETLTGLGDGVFWVALIVTISERSDFTTLLTAAVVVRLGPRALLSLPVGGLVDRSNVRSVLLATDLVRAVVMLAIAIGIDRGLTAPWVLVGVLVSHLFGVAWRPALAASLPSVVGESELAHANALISTIRQAMTFVGPLVGVGVASVSVPAAFALNGATNAISALCVALVTGVRWPRPNRERGTRTAGPAGAAGIGPVDGLTTFLSLTAVMYLVRGAEMVLHVLVVRDLIRADPSAIGYLSGAVGLGAVAVTPLARRLAASDRALVPLLGSMAVTAVPTALLASVGDLSVAALLVVPVGAGMIVFEVITVVTIQRTVPSGSLGRVFGAVNTASNGGKLVGAVATPALVSVLDVEAALLVVAAVVAGGAAIACRPLARLSRRGEEQRRRLAPIVAVLADLELFAGAPQTSLERLARHVGEEQLEPGEVLIREGDEADDLFVIRSGEFEVGADGVTVNHVAGGDWVGEIGLVEHLARTATVRALTEATVWRIPGSLFLAVLAGSDDASSLDDVITRRLAAGRSSLSTP